MININANDTHLLVHFTPAAIREHYECYYMGDSLYGYATDERKRVYEFVKNASEDTLRQIGESAINDELLWRTFDSVLAAAVDEALDEQEAAAAASKKPTTEWVLTGDDNDELAYWSNEHGWVTDVEQATTFTMSEVEAFSEPQGSIGWMPKVKALDKIVDSQMEAILVALYDVGGKSAVCKWAAKNRPYWKWDVCPHCEDSTPTWGAGDRAVCAVCFSTRESNE